MENDTEVLFIPANEYIEFLKSDIDLCMKMISVLALKNSHLNMMLGNITLKDVTTRLASFILKEIEKQDSKDGKIIIDISRYDLAAYLGTIQETLSRSLKRLQDRKILEVDGKLITVTNLSELKKISV